MGAKKVFISHTSQEAPLALLLKTWIDAHFPGQVEAFVSKSDIVGGVQWLQVVESALRDASLVIVLCSPVSIRKTWVIFEAGGAWGRAVPLLPICHSGLAVADLPSPLSAFQGLAATGADFPAQLMRTLSSGLEIGAPPVGDTASMAEDLNQTVETARHDAKRFDVFVSAPMSSLRGPRYSEFRKSLDGLFDNLAATPALKRFYFAGKAFGDVRDFDDSLVGAKRDMRALASSDRFLMILPEKLVTSSLVEAGFALALGLPSVLFVRKTDHLPYVLQNIGQVSDHTNVHTFDQPDEAARRIAQYGTDLWPSIWGRAYV